jgi:uncharacterized small protein (DUF1192 family)
MDGRYVSFNHSASFEQGFEFGEDDGANGHHDVDPGLVILELRERIVDLEAELHRLRAQVASQRALLQELQSRELLLLNEDGRHEDNGRQGGHDHPLLAAARSGDERMVSVLLEGGADARVSHDAPLLAACQHGHVGVAELLLDAGADVDVDHGSPLLWAVRRGDAPLCETLLARGATVDVLRGCPLKLAVACRHHTVAGLLMRHGAARGDREAER